MHQERCSGHAANDAGRRCILDARRVHKPFAGQPYDHEGTRTCIQSATDRQPGAVAGRPIWNRRSIKLQVDVLPLQHDPLLDFPSPRPVPRSLHPSLPIQALPFRGSDFIDLRTRSEPELFPGVYCSSQQEYPPRASLPRKVFDQNVHRIHEQPFPQEAACALR